MSFSAPENDTQTTKEVSRRTLVKGAAWAVPVIAFAAPAPAMAASPCTPSTNFDGLTPGNTVQTSIVFYNSLNQPTGVTASIAYASDRSGRRLDSGRYGNRRGDLDQPVVELHRDRDAQRVERGGLGDAHPDASARPSAA